MGNSGSDDRLDSGMLEEVYLSGDDTALIPLTDLMMDMGFKERQIQKYIDWVTAVCLNQRK